jgi:hypothetical protein
VGVILVVVVEPGADLGEHRGGVVEPGEVHLVAPEGLHEGLSHAVGLGRVRGRGADEEAAVLAEGARVLGRARRAVVAEPLDGMDPAESSTPRPTCATRIIDLVILDRCEAVDPQSH